MGNSYIDDYQQYKEETEEAMTVQHPGTDASSPLLYMRGVKSDCFYLILQGSVQVLSGNEGFQVNQSAFHFLGQECLLMDSYVPDFSAKAIGPRTKLLKIMR